MKLLPLRLSTPAFFRTPKSFAHLFAVLLFCWTTTVLAQEVSYTGAVSPVSFGTVNLCASGAATPAPCSKSLALTYKVTASGSLATPKVLTQGSPNLDYTLAAGSTCVGYVAAGATCSVNVKFVPLNAGARPGAVQIVDESGKALATTYLTGSGSGAKAGFVTLRVGQQPYGGLNGIPEQVPIPQSSPGLSVAGVAVDGAEDLFVSYGNQVIKLAAGTYQPVVLPFSGLDQPAGLAIDGAGNLFVADEGNARILELPTGSNEQVKLPFSGLVGPKGVAVDNKGDVYVSDAAANRVLELSSSGTQRTLPFTSPDSPSDFLAGGIAVDSTGTVYASYPHSVVALPAGSSSGTVVFGVSTDLYSGVAVDGAGDLFISGHDQSFNIGLLDELVQGGAFANNFNSPGYENLAYFGLSLAVSGNGNLFTGTAASQTASGQLLSLQRSRTPVVNFGTYGVDVTNFDLQPLAISNLGTSPMNVRLLFNSNQYSVATGISIPSTAMQYACLQSIQPQQNCIIYLAFLPTVNNEQSGYMIAVTNGPDNPRLKLVGISQVEPPVFVRSYNSLGPLFGVYPGPVTIEIDPPFATTVTPDIYYTTDGTAPTTNSTLYTGPITLNATGTIRAIEVIGGVSSTPASLSLIIASSTPAQSVSGAEGFLWPTPNHANGDAVASDAFYPTNHNFPPGQLGVGSDFYTIPLDTDAFTTLFTVTPYTGYGLTFAIQNEGTTALGSSGSGLGYAGIGHSVALKFDVAGDAGEGPNSIGLYTDGATPTVPAIDLTGTGINLHSGGSFQVLTTYDGHNLGVSLTDVSSLATWSHTFPVNIPAIVGGDKAYFGFTGSAAPTNLFEDTPSVFDWTYISGAPEQAPPLPIPDLPTYPQGFIPAGLIANGSASVGSTMRLTNNSKLTASSVFYSKPVNIQSFHTNFAFLLSGQLFISDSAAPITLPPLSTLADGFTFTIQNTGVNAVGELGGGLGYASIGKSVAVKFDLHNNAGEGANSTGVYANGEMPTVPAIDLDGTAIDLHSGDPVLAEIDYDGSYLKMKLTDSYTKLVWTSAPIPINIPATVGGNTAYVGFTAGTGTLSSVQQVLNWTFTNP